MGELCAVIAATICFEWVLLIGLYRLTSIDPFRIRHAVLLGCVVFGLILIEYMVVAISIMYSSLLATMTLIALEIAVPIVQYRYAGCDVLLEEIEEGEI